MKNDYKIEDGYVTMYLNRSTGEILETKLCMEYFEKIKDYNYKWFAHWNYKTKSYYVRTTEYLGFFDGKQKNRIFYLHRFLTDAGAGEYVDHINHDTLDHRKENLRVIKNKENTKNRNGKNTNNTSGYRNVSWSNSAKKWLVQLQINSKNKVLGSFDDVHEAGKFAEEMRQKYYGKFAGTNDNRQYA